MTAQNPMPKRPLSLTLIAWIFIAVGCLGFFYHLSEFKGRPSFDYALAGVCVIRLLAVVGGIGMLRGLGWARWLLAVWMAFHVAVSALHNVSELVMHIVIFGVLAVFIFRPQANAYFRQRKDKVAEPSRL
jgi:hypothetical protein